jgi:hypothetical protein
MGRFLSTLIFDPDDVLFVRLRELILSVVSVHAARKTRPAGTSPVVTRCLVPRNRGALYHDLRRDELWGKFFTAAPQRLRRSVEQYKIIKRA